jgi:hypothetical protein
MTTQAVVIRNGLRIHIAFSKSFRATYCVRIRRQSPSGRQADFFKRMQINEISSYRESVPVEKNAAALPSRRF